MAGKACAELQSSQSFALYAHGEIGLVGYNWMCLVCNSGVDKKLEHCPNCGYLAGANGHEVDARRMLLKLAECEHPLDCPECFKRKIDIKFSKDAQKYYYVGIKGRLVFFEILYLYIFCKSCQYQQEIEFDVPILRRIFRWVTKRDIKNESLKRI